ncbi:hypothetical protein ABIE45_001247 [Methylobacterium sp. OAE515]|uniref:hypothetical protein n=1 Tax=Methylobacterium sp. OAE515 TaxID=2817895 RepID=UPI0019E639F5
MLPLPTPFAGIILAFAPLSVRRPAGLEVIGDLRLRQSTLLHLCSVAKRPITMADVLGLSIAA